MLVSENVYPTFYQDGVVLRLLETKCNQSFHKVGSKFHKRIAGTQRVRVFVVHRDLLDLKPEQLIPSSHHTTSSLISKSLNGFHEPPDNKKPTRVSDWRWLGTHELALERYV